MSQKHKNEAGDGPRIQDAPIAFYTSFSIFGILHNIWILYSNEGGSFSVSPTFLSAPAFPLLRT